MFLPRSRRMLALACVLCAAAASRLHAQAPVPAQIPWSQPRARVDATLQQMGFRGSSTAPPSDTSLLFTAERRGVHSEIRLRIRNGVLWHAFYTAQGDSVAVQRDLAQTATVLTARYGAPHVEGDDRVWIVEGSRRVALPSAPRRLDNGQYGYGVMYGKP